jgi:succinate dehydrogenase/fumarate reductase flavoprotein subunit
MPQVETFDVIVLGSGIAGLAAALAAHEHGLRPLLIEKADLIGGTTSDSYGLIWVGGNHLMRRAREIDTREDIIRYMTFLGGGELSEDRVLALVDRSPEVLAYYESCGIPFRMMGGIVDHYLGVAAGARGPGRTLEAELISGFELGAWRDKVRTPKDAPYSSPPRSNMPGAGSTAIPPGTRTWCASAATRTCAARASASSLTL